MIKILTNKIKIMKADNKLLNEKINENKLNNKKYITEDDLINVTSYKDWTELQMRSGMIKSSLVQVLNKVTLWTQNNRHN